MILARPIYGRQGGLLLNKGVTLTSRYIRALKNHGVMAAYVKDIFTCDLLEAQNALEDEVRVEAMNVTKSWFDASKKENAFAAFVAVENSVKNIVEEIISGKACIGSLTEISAADSYTFAHSVDVCVLAVATGYKYGYIKEDLIKLGLGSLLHDLGKTKISPDILNKPGKLTDREFAEIKKHPVWSYELLKEKTGDLITPLSLGVVLYHHERYDGTGYPRGLKGEEIHDMAAICAVADVYNAMTTDRVYRKAIPPHEVYEMLMGAGNTMFKYKVVNAFLSCVVPYPVGTFVRLNTGEAAYVVDTDPAFPFQPLVHLILDNKPVNLKHKPTVVIQGLLSPEEKQKLLTLNNKAAKLNIGL